MAMDKGGQRLPAHAQPRSDLTGSAASEDTWANNQRVAHFEVGCVLRITYYVLRITYYVLRITYCILWPHMRF